MMLAAYATLPKDLVQSTVTTNIIWKLDQRSKEKEKEATRSQNVEVHVAIAVVGLIARITGVIAATVALATDEASTRTSIAVASTTALVPAQCVEVAERNGADRDHMPAIVSSTVNVRSARDIMTL
jgi:hypothetical protein